MRKFMFFLSLLIGLAGGFAGYRLVDDFLYKLEEIPVLFERDPSFVESIRNEDIEVIFDDRQARAYFIITGAMVDDWEFKSQDKRVCIVSPHLIGIKSGGWHRYTDYGSSDHYRFKKFVYLLEKVVFIFGISLVAIVGLFVPRLILNLLKSLVALVRKGNSSQCFLASIFIHLIPGIMLFMWWKDWGFDTELFDKWFDPFFFIILFLICIFIFDWMLLASQKSSEQSMDKVRSE